MDRAFRPLLERHDVPGMAVAVTVAGRRSFFTYGLASKETNAPVTKDTLFEIGSVSKTFTGTLACYAQTLGRLSLDDHPSRHMPELRGSAIDRATLLNLGTYTAGGLPLQFPAEVGDPAEMATYFRRWRASSAPGALRRYSNPSIGLLGHITGLAMNRRFADIAEGDLFPGLGLRKTYIRVPAAQIPSYAYGYNSANAPVRVNPGVLADEAYGVKSTAADMIRFVEANLYSARLGAPMRRAVESTRLGHFRVGPMVQGIGWEQYPYPIPLDRLLAGNSPAIIMESNRTVRLAPPHRPAGPTLFNKTGSTAGFGAYVAFVPARRIGIVMLANRNFPIPARITAAHAVLDQLSARA